MKSIVIIALCFLFFSGNKEVVEVNDLTKDTDLNQYQNVVEEEILSEKLVKDSKWKEYESIDDYGKEGQKALDTDFISSDGRGYNNGIKFELRDILYDYGQEINKNLLLNYWEIERVIPIGNDYYNVVIYQEAENIRINMLFDYAELEYIILYAACEEGNRTTYNDKKYYSQASWKSYLDMYSGDVIVSIDNPFADVMEISTHTNLDAALSTHLENTNYAKEWSVKEIYGSYSLIDYLLESENEVVWFCLDVYRNEFVAVRFEKEVQ